MTITEAEIVAAAKAIYAKESFAVEWDSQPVHWKWIWLERAYASLRAAREARRGK